MWWIAAAWLAWIGLGVQTPAASKVPDGFTSIFNGRDLAGWHISRTNHHGTTPDWHVVDGELRGRQQPPGRGGILLTDEKYRDVEVSLELKPDWGCDGGLFLRSNERGQAYQVMIDYLEGGSVGGIYGEGLKTATGGGIGVRDTGYEKVWRKDDWNHLRARIEGEIPRIRVWINDTLVTDFTDTANHLPDGATEGMIAVQIHFSSPETPRWVEGGLHRYRNIAVRRVP